MPLLVAAVAAVAAIAVVVVVAVVAATVAKILIRVLRGAFWHYRRYFSSRHRVKHALLKQNLVLNDRQHQHFRVQSLLLLLLLDSTFCNGMIDVLLLLRAKERKRADCRC